jgi:hypothetical protein
MDPLFSQGFGFFERADRLSDPSVLEEGGMEQVERLI